MGHRRTGWGVSERQDRFAGKILTMDEAYTQAIGDMTVQGQNLASLLSAVKEVFQAWANSKGLMGPVRIAYRNYILEIVKAKNQGYDAETLRIKMKALRYKYSLMGLIDGYLEELEELANQVKATVNDYITLSKIAKSAGK